MEVSVVIPCLNEVETIGTCIAKALRALDVEHIDGEVIVSDTGSTDGSQEIAARLGARVLNVEGRGF
jgi:glycosyltransferase involved in cell wall biosynthesis